MMIAMAQVASAEIPPPTVPTTKVVTKLAISTHVIDVCHSKQELMGAQSSILRTRFQVTCNLMSIVMTGLKGR